MTLIDVEELCAYWAEHPPVHVMVAGLLGIGRHRGTARGGQADRNLEAIVSELGPGMAVGEVGTGLPAAVLDFEQLRMAQG